MREVEFGNGEYYHIFNRGVEKRNIFKSKQDIERFLLSIKEFNTTRPIGSIYQKSFLKEKGQFSIPDIKLVEVVCYCLNPNHYHIILKQLTENGVQKFMHKLGMGYSRYFNEKNKRSGALFQGRFKAVHIDSNEQLLHTSVYVNLNNKVHKIGGGLDRIIKSSWDEYIGKTEGEKVCSEKIILNQFENVNDYKSYSKEALKMILENKEYYKELE